MSEENDKKEADDGSVEVTIPAHVFVECPMVQKKLRAVSRCLECEHYAGFHRRFENGKHSFAKTYQVACRFPFARALFETETAGEA